MTSSQVLGTSLVLLLLGLPLISWGATQSLPLVFWAGFLAILAGAALPPIARIAGWGAAQSQAGTESETR